MMSECGSSVIKLPLLLLALSAGYAVLVASQKQQRPLDVLGRLIGAIVLLVSFLSLLCMAVCSVSSRFGKCGSGVASGCPLMGGGSAHCAMPHGDQAQTEEAPAENAQ